MLKVNVKVFLLVLMLMYMGAITVTPACVDKESNKDGVPLPVCSPMPPPCNSQMTRGETALPRGSDSAESPRFMEVPSPAV
jgi:hypothetical protein